MNDLERELAALLAEDARQAPLVATTPPGITARVRRRQAGTVVAAGLGILGLVLVSLASVRALTRTSTPETHPTSISSLHHNGEIVVPTADGLTSIDPATGAARQLVACPIPCEELQHPVWSPDGTKLAYEVDSNSGAIGSDLGVWVLDPATGMTHQLTRFPTGCKVPSSLSSVPNGSSAYISWSTDGSRIAFEQCGVYVMNADGSGKTRVTDFGVEPTLSPDGSRIAFVGSAKGRNILYEVNADGSGLTRLVSVHSQLSHPAWSPDGSQIAYDLDFPFQIWVVGADGRHPTKVFDDSRCCITHGWGGPAWSPDGTRIAFDVWHGSCAPNCLIVIDADGSHPHLLPLSYSTPDRPAWRPIP